jgi:hypothetical protein
MSWLPVRRTSYLKVLMDNILPVLPAGAEDTEVSNSEISLTLILT